MKLHKYIILTGPLVSDPVGQNPLCIKSMDWSAEGYQMWIVNSKIRSQKITDPEFMPFPENFEENSKNENNDDKNASNPLGNKSLVLQFVKSPSSVNPYMTKQVISRFFLYLPSLPYKTHFSAEMLRFDNFL